MHAWLLMGVYAAPGGETPSRPKRGMCRLSLSTAPPSEPQAGVVAAGPALAAGHQVHPMPPLTEVAESLGGQTAWGSDGVEGDGLTEVASTSDAPEVAALGALPVIELAAGSVASDVFVIPLAEASEADIRMLGGGSACTSGARLGGTLTLRDGGHSSLGAVTEPAGEPDSRLGGAAAPVPPGAVGATPPARAAVLPRALRPRAGAAAAPAQAPGDSAVLVPPADAEVGSGVWLGWAWRTYAPCAGAVLGRTLVWRRSKAGYVLCFVAAESAALRGRRLSGQWGLYCVEHGGFESLKEGHRVLLGRYLGLEVSPPFSSEALCMAWVATRPRSDRTLVCRRAGAWVAIAPGGEGGSHLYLINDCRDTGVRQNVRIGEFGDFFLEDDVVASISTSATPTR